MASCRLIHSKHRFRDIGKGVSFLEWLRGWKPIPLCWWFEKHGWPIPKYFIGGGDVDPQFEGSRHANADMSFTWAEDVNVAGWPVGDDFCISMGWGVPAGKKVLTRQVRIEWNKDGGGWTALANVGELTWNGATSLVNGDPLTEAESGLTAPAANYQQGMEREGANDWTFPELVNDTYWTAAMWAINCDGAAAGSVYQFRLYNVSGGVVTGNGVTVTMASARRIFITHQ